MLCMPSCSLLVLAFVTWQAPACPWTSCLSGDREKKKVVVALRGTQSIADLVTDAVVHPEPMEDWIPTVSPWSPSLRQTLALPISGHLCHACLSKLRLIAAKPTPV